MKRINRKKFNNSFRRAESYIKSFPDANVQELEHYVTPHLQDQKADATIKHIGCDNINYRDLSEIGIYKLQRISLIQE